MKRVTSLILMMLLLSFFWTTTAQVSTYTFTGSSGVYTPITGGTVHATAAWDDTMIPSIALGFTFVFDGNAYTSVTISPNGYVIFGGTASLTYNPISSTIAAPGCAAALGRDLQGVAATGEIRSETIGSAGNYIFVVQWTDAKRYGTSYADEVFDMQIRLLENGNKIQFVYGAFTGSAYASPVHPQVGLRGPTNAAFFNRTTTTNWAATTPGITSADVCTLTNLVFPANGQTFTFQPPAATAPGLPNTPSPANLAGNVTITPTLTWNFGLNTSTYDLYFGTDNPPMTKVVDNAAAGATGSYIPGTLSYNTPYFWYIVAKNNADLETVGPLWSFTTQCETVNAPFVETFDIWPPNCWSLTGGTHSWVQYNVAPVLCAKANFWSQSAGSTDIMTTPPISIAGLAAPNLKFDWSHLYSSTYPLDALTVLVSDDGGLSYDQVWYKAGTDLNSNDGAANTAPGSFVSSGNIDLSGFGDVVLVKFYGYSGYGPDLFVDNVTVYEPSFGTLAGNVTSATSKGPIEGALITAGDYSTTTDQFGDYTIPDMAVGTYDVTCEADGYFAQTVTGVVITVNQTTTQDFVLGFAQITVNPTSLTETLLPDATATQTLTISNPGGTEPLTWSASIQMLVPERSNLQVLTQTQPKTNNLADDIDTNPSNYKPEATDAMFDLLGSFPVHDVGGTYSVATDGNFLYTGRWNLNQYDKYALDGTWIESFSIPGAGLTRDLAFDGQYFYGSPNSAVIYQMDFNTKTLVSSITATGNQVRGIAYDPDTDGFWVTAASFTGPFRRIDRTGATVQTVTPAFGGISGLAYDNVTPGGPYLWAYTPAASTNTHIIIQVDMTGATVQQFDLATFGITAAGTVSGGLEISDGAVPGKWSIMGVSQNDIVWLLELAESSSWLSLDENNGVIEPGQSQVVNVTFDATGLVDSTYLANINITHNGQQVTDGVVSVPVALTVASTTPPIAPTLVSPAAGATLVPLQPVFEWLAGAGTSQVQIEIKRGSGPFSVTIHKSLWMPNTIESYSLAEQGVTLLKKQVYTWLVRAKNAAGTVASGTRNFTTIGAGTVGGVVTDAFNNAPLSGATVTIPATGQSATTGADGSYTIANVLEGTYDVTAELEGYIGQTKSATVVHNQLALTNFALNLFLDPPTGLHTNVVNFNDVHVSWIAPGAGFDPVWLQWCQETSTNSIGTGAAATFDVAARFTPDMLSGFPGGAVTKVQFIPAVAIPACAYEIRIWQGVSPPTLVYSQPVPAVTISVWNEVILNTPVPIDLGQELWIGYNVNTTTGYPAGCDAGPQVEGFGNMINWGGWTTLTALNPALTYNWSIKGYVEAAKGAGVLEPVKQTASNFLNTGTLTSNPVKFYAPAFVPTESSKALLGYNLYKDGSLLAYTTETSYDDMNLLSGTYSYTVTGVYPQGESAPVGPAYAEVLLAPVMTVADPDFYGIDLAWQSNVSDNIQKGMYSTSNIQKEKYKAPATGVYDPTLYPSPKQGGETIATALAIAALPYADQGTTTGYLNDYDEACPYTGSTAPDVVYSFVPAEDLLITISVCESLYDTKLYVYENTYTQGNPYACNDDYATCTDYQSQIDDLYVQAGNTYYIVIDGYGTANGTYYLDITGEPYVPCVVECPVGAIAEGETCPTDGYEDTFNGGCNSIPAVYSPISCGDIICGTSSTYIFDGLNYRDTDWYELVLDEPKTLTWSVTAEFPVIAFILDGNMGCAGYFTVAQGIGAPCETAVATATVAPGTYWLWVGPQVFTGYPCGDANDYVAELTCEDAFLTYYKLFRNQEEIAQVYATSYRDEAIENGATYCYAVSEVVSPELETPQSNVLCATVPLIPAIGVNPAELSETHLEPPMITTQTVTVTNTALGTLDWNLEVVMNEAAKGAKAYCDASTTTQDEYIANVTCGSINNSSGWQGGVADYTALSTTIEAGAAEPITVTNGNAWAADIVYCWVDWDMSETWDQATNEEYMLTNVGGTGLTFTGAIAVPEDVATGSYRMRVRMTYSTAPVPCGVATYGEVEDYTINVLGGAQWMTADVLSGSLGAGESTDITVTFNSEELDFGNYMGALNFTSNDPVTPFKQVPVTFDVVSNLSTITGTVTDALAKGPVEGVTILVDELRGYTTMTLADGTYSIDVPVGVYNITASKIGYISQTVTGVATVLGQTIVQDFMLEFAAPVLTNADPDFFGVMVEWDGNPAFGYPYKGAAPAYSLSNVEEKPALSKEERLHGPTVVVPMNNSKSRATGDDCSDPLVIGGFPYTDINTTCGRLNDYAETCLGYYDGGEDIIYSFTLAETKTLEFAMTTTDTWTGMLLTNTCPPTSTCIAFATNVGAGGVTFTQELAPGTYYIMIDTWPAPTCITQFTLEITEAGAAGPGETCETAVMAYEGVNTSPMAPYWFEFTPSIDGLVTVSSCIVDQLVDTDVEIYDACGGLLVAENDDFAGCASYGYSSTASFQGTAGVAYKIKWIDTWEATGFDFTITVTTCEIECPVNAIDEGELCGEDTNGGCNANPTAFGTVACGDIICGSAWADLGTRDTDWYQIVLDAPKTLTWTVNAEFPVYAFIIDGNMGCVANMELIGIGMANPCEPAVATATVTPGIYWLWVGSQVFEGYPCGDNNTYVAELTCEDAFVTYYNLYRDGDVIAQTYGTSYYDEAIEQGETYCYTVDQVIQPGLVTGISNEMCATVPIQPVISVDPLSITESLEVGGTSTQNLEIMNGSAGDLEFEVITVLGGPVKANTGFTPEYPAAQVSQEAAENIEEGGNQGFKPTYSQPLNNSKDLLWNNGELINSMCATTSALESMIVAPATLYGSNFNQAGGFIVADDFTIPAGQWTIESFDFYGYQTGSTTTSTFTGAYVQIWNGDPLVSGSAPIWGDLTTNVMTSSTFTGIYRVSATASCNTQRPIMKITASTPGLTLESGTYYVAWATTGSLTSGPWVPIVNAFVPGSTTGARQYSPTTLLWAAVESPVGNYLDFAFDINGSGETPWLTVSPEFGTINGVGSMYLDVNFNAADLAEGVYTAEIAVLSNDPITPSILVPVTLYVGMDVQQVALPQGWSAWSSYMNPDAKMTMEELMAPVVDNMVITQYFNQLYYPLYNINTLGEFSNEHGYVTKMSEEASLTMMGAMADPTVSLVAGWNLFPVLRECPIGAADVFSNMPGFIIAYEIGGNGIWYPAGGIYTLVDLVPGKAYWVKVMGAFDYTFPVCLTKGGFANTLPLRPENNTNWNDVSFTGLSHAVIFSEKATSELLTGDVIGAFTSAGICAGMVEVTNAGNGFVMFGDDITTAAADGFTEGETMSFKLFRQATGEEFTMDVTYSTQVPNHDGNFAINGLSVISDLTLKSTGIGNVDLGNLSIYPNPSTGIFNVVINDLDKDINYTIVNAQGQEVYTGKLLETQQIDLSTQPKGVYFIKFSNETVLRIEKLVIK